MGGNKSKPVKESARTVLARRRRDVVENIIQSPSPSITTTTTTSTSSTTTTTTAIQSPSSSAAQSTIDRINNHIEKPIINKMIGPNDGLDLDPKILNTIDKWVLKESKVNYPGYDTNKSQMATTIRLEEEKEILKETGKMPMNIKGRLTEDQISRFYDLIKENDIDKSNDEYLSNQFSIPIDTVKILKKITRKPIIYMDGWGEIKDQPVGK